MGGEGGEREERRGEEGDKRVLAEGEWRESADGGLVDKARQAVVKCDRSEDLLHKYTCIHVYFCTSTKQLPSSVIVRIENCLNSAH